MQRAAAILLAAALSAAAADPQVPRLVRSVETSAPVAQRLDLVHGETLDLQFRFTSYATAIDILGAAVTLHARTNGMAEGSSFQAAGSAGAGGVATVRLAVSEWLPAACTNAAWTLEVAQTNAVRILRASGDARISGSSAASTNDPVPAVWLDDIRAEIAAATGGVSAVYGPRLDAVEAWPTNDWRAAYSWGDHSQAGYLLPADIAGLATTGQVAAAAAAKLDASSTAADLRAEWVAATLGYDDIGHLRIYNPVSQESVYIGPYGFGQWRYMDAEFYPAGVDRFVSWGDVAVRADIADASNNLSGVIGALDAAGVGALPSAGTVSGLSVEWKTSVYPETDEGHLRIFDPVNGNEILLNPHGFGQWRAPDPEYPDGLDRYVPWSSVATLDDIAAIPPQDLSGRVAVSAGVATNLTTRGWLALPQSQATNLVLRLVCSNDHIIVEEVYQ